MKKLVPCYIVEKMNNYDFGTKITKMFYAKKEDAEKYADYCGDASLVYVKIYAGCADSEEVFF